MKVLITGATGFVGQTLVPYFLESGYNDICLIVRNIQKGQLLFKSNLITFISTENNSWIDLVQDYNPDIVLHLATFFTGRSDATSVIDIVNTNILFSSQLLEAISHTHCKCFINIGTFTEYFWGDGSYQPNNLYSASKTALRPIIQYYQSQASFKWLNIIVYSPYGRKNTSKKVLDYLIDALDSENPIAFSKGEQVLDFIHVDDMASFFDTLMKQMNELNAKFYEFHLGTGNGYTIREIAALIEQISQKKINAVWGGRNYHPSDVMFAVAPMNKTYSLLNWKPRVSIEEGLKILLKDYGK